MLINAGIALASLFTREKVLERIRFAELSEVKAEIPDDSLPHHVGGGSPISTPEALIEWVHQRLSNFPKLPDF